MFTIILSVTMDVIHSDQWLYHWYGIGQWSKNCIINALMIHQWSDLNPIGDTTRHFETKPRNHTPMKANDKMTRMALNHLLEHDVSLSIMQQHVACWCTPQNIDFVSSYHPLGTKHMLCNECLFPVHKCPVASNIFINQAYLVHILITTGKNASCNAWCFH